MANVPPRAPAPAQSPLFASLVARYGLQGALTILSFMDPNASRLAKAASGAQLGTQALGAAGTLGGAPGLANLAGIAGRGLGLGLSAYNIYNTATDPRLSRAQQVGHSGRGVADAIMSLAIPYYGIGKAVSALGQHFQGSGSPQVRGLGRTIDYGVEPAGAKAFWNVLQGDLSPKAAFKRQGGLEGLTLDMMGPIGLIMRGLGVKLPFLSHTPTTGTMFRREADRLLSQFPALQGTDTSRYNIPLDAYNALPLDVRTRARSLADQLIGYAPSAKSNPEAYAIQLQNMLLNRFGANLPQVTLPGR